jgi:cytochrome c-type biogenesis protein CcmH/NrfG
MSARIGVAVMAALLALYIVFVAQRAWLLLVSGQPLGVAMGAALLVLPIIAAWALWRELMFGIRAEQLGRELEREGGLPAEDVALRPSGRVQRDDADAAFPAYREDVQAHPDDWRSWYRLGIAYDAAGDRRRAREAIRKAIAMHRAAGRA